MTFEMFRNNESQEDAAFRDAIANVIEDYFKESQLGFFKRLQDQVIDDGFGIDDSTCNPQPETCPDRPTPPEQPTPPECPAPPQQPTNPEQPECAPEQSPEEIRQPFSAKEAALLVLRNNFDEIDTPKLLGSGNEDAAGNAILERSEVRKWFNENKEGLSRFEREGFHNLLDDWSRVSRQYNDQAGKETGATMNDIETLYNKKVQKSAVKGYDGGSLV